MNKKLLEQLGLAKQAGTQAMAKDFFAKTPSPGADADVPTEGLQMSAGPTNDENPEGAMPGGEPDGDELTPEQLEELLQMLGGQSEG